MAPRGSHRTLTVTRNQEDNLRNTTTSLSLLRQDDFKTRNDTKFYITQMTKHRSASNNGSNNKTMNQQQHNRIRPTLLNERILALFGKPTWFEKRLFNLLPHRDAF